MKKTTAEAMLPDKAYFRIDEIAEYWGVTERSVRSYIDNGNLKAVRVGGTIKIPREAVITFPVEVGNK